MYAERLIEEFSAGTLPLEGGTTLRALLSQLLHCDPMRISKKFANAGSIGKLKFKRASEGQFTDEELQQKRTELCDLERQYLDRVAQTERTNHEETRKRPYVEHCMGQQPPKHVKEQEPMEYASYSDVVQRQTDRSPERQQNQQATEATWLRSFSRTTYKEDESSSIEGDTGD